jgi:hypothetical protein
MDFSDDLPSAAVTIPPRKPQATSALAIRAVEDEIYVESVTTVRDALRFNEIDHEWTEPPVEWVAELGEHEAKKRFRLARYGCMPGKDVPFGLKLAQDTLVGIAKARATEKAGPKTLNMIYVKISAPMPEFEEVEVDQ